MPTGLGGDLYKLLGIGGTERCQGSDCGTHVFALLGNLSIVQINHFTFLYNKINRRTNCPNLFCQEILHVSGSSSVIIRSFALYIRHWYVSCSFHDNFQAVPGWSCLKVVIKTA